MTATSSEIWLVIASRSTEAIMARKNHRARRPRVGGRLSLGTAEARGLSARTGARPARIAAPPQLRANSRKPPDHSQP
jgi:hypothetical protein